MRILKHFLEIRVWYRSACRRLGVPAYGPIVIFLLVALLFAGSRMPGKRCIPKEELATLTAIDLEKEKAEREKTFVLSDFPFDYCALQWKLFLESIDKPRLLKTR